MHNCFRLTVISREIIKVLRGIINISSFLPSPFLSPSFLFERERKREREREKDAIV